METIKVNIILADEYLLHDKDRAFLYLVFLHYNGIISDDKFKGMLKNLRPIDSKADVLDIPLLRRVGTYHNTINDVWYNDESMVNILRMTVDGFKVSMSKIDMPLVDFLSYINLLINKNKNFCVDYFYYQIVEPLVRHYVDNFMNYYGCGYTYLLSMCSGYDFKGKASEWDRYSFGYCCEDCDGDYEDAKRSSFEANVLYGLYEELEKHYQNILGEYKTADRFKNTNCKF